MIIAVPFFIMLAGLIMYVLCTQPKLTEIGRIMFWTGLLSILLESHEVLVALTK
jgi:hypothetical protein